MKALFIALLITGCGYEVTKDKDEPQPQDGTGCTVTQFGDETTGGQTAIIACEDGTQAKVSSGRDGKDGEQGKPGTDGTQGDAGKDGQSCRTERRNVKYTAKHVHYDVYVVCGDNAELISRNKEKTTAR